jgi:hypothetical protein
MEVIMVSSWSFYALPAAEFPRITFIVSPLSDKTSSRQFGEWRRVALFV